ncbi:Maf family protein [Sediminibacillus halophilus]|uniref:dTTP/UTP pyrophosphatase n=1 Tax=Sediminibacillus halophilus TaxID=482461 RepID=A0A1G9XNZ5_9BACI|nr:Maf family protein [Sediminibacillus halophilus]SDM98484.1 septum formation protein [Sediminibacillus halophilus]
MQLILASGSPRRKKLLEQAGLQFLTKIPDVDEQSVTASDACQLVKKLAVMKGEKLPPAKGEVVLSADTVVSQHERILTKPESREDAFAMLSELNGETHQVHTGVSIRSQGKSTVFSVATKVTFWEMTDEQLAAYIDTGEPFDKAGAYGIQGKGALLVQKIHGDYFNVVGLPLSKVVRELEHFGIVPFSSG